MKWEEISKANTKGLKNVTAELPITQQLRALATLAEDPCLVPRPHIESHNYLYLQVRGIWLPMLSFWEHQAHRRQNIHTHFLFFLSFFQWLISHTVLQKDLGSVLAPTSTSNSNSKVSNTLYSACGYCTHVVHIHIHNKQIVLLIFLKSSMEVSTRIKHPFLFDTQNALRFTLLFSW